jgi:hypothetical protein
VTTESAPKTPPNRNDIRRYQSNLDDEIDGIAIYQMLAETEKDPERVRIFRDLAEVEVRHANVWREKLREAGVEPREHGPSLKVRLLSVAARVFGVGSVIPIAVMRPGRTARTYAGRDRRRWPRMSASTG